MLLARRMLPKLLDHDLESCRNFFGFPPYDATLEREPLVLFFFYMGYCADSVPAAAAAAASAAAAPAADDSVTRAAATVLQPNRRRLQL